MEKTLRKKIIIGTIGTVFVLLIIFALKPLFFKSSNIDNLLMQDARDKNKTCPVFVDHETRLDNTTVLPGNIFQYNYTLVYRLKDSIQIENLRAYLEPSILSNVKTNPDLRFQRDNNVTVSFNYKDKEGRFILRISIPPDIYLK